MNKLVFVFILLFYSEFILPQDILDVPSYFYKRFEGKINDSLNIQMNLTRIDSVLIGSYFYENSGEPLWFGYYSFIRDDSSLHIEEEGGFEQKYYAIKTGIFDGKFTSGDEIKGKWQNTDSGEAFNFSLQENYPAGSAKFDIKHLNKNYGESDYSGFAASIELTYPVMIDYPDEKVQQRINSYIIDFYLNRSIEGDGIHRDMNDRMDSFIESYRTEIEADSEIYNDYKPIYENIENTTISFNSDNILSLEISEYLFTGGAHGNSTFTLACFNLATGEKIKLDDIFYGNYRKILNSAGEKIFRELFKADSTRSLYEQGFFGFENGFELNDNFDLFKGGIKFQFNPYEAGAYALGAPEVFIPWTEIRNIIRDNSPIAEMLINAQSR